MKNTLSKLAGFNLVISALVAGFAFSGCVKRGAVGVGQEKAAAKKAAAKAAEEKALDEELNGKIYTASELQLTEGELADLSLDLAVNNVTFAPVKDASGKATGEYAFNEESLKAAKAAGVDVGAKLDALFVKLTEFNDKYGRRPVEGVEEARRQKLLAVCFALTNAVTKAKQVLDPTPAKDGASQPAPVAEPAKSEEPKKS